MKFKFLILYLLVFLFYSLEEPNNVLDEFSYINWKEPNSFIPPSPIILYIRIIGNDLPPRHKSDQTLINLKFILDNESDFQQFNVHKFWIINRIYDQKKLKKIEELLSQYNQSYGLIPMNMEKFTSQPYEVGNFPIPDFIHSPLLFQLSSGMRVQAIDHIYHAKNLYAIHNNGGRNIAIELGKFLKATWTMVFDGNCFMTLPSMTALNSELAKNIAQYSNSPSYIVIPMLRVLNNSILLDASQSLNISLANEEPQVIFRNDSSLAFQPTFRYGRRPKLDFLWRLGYPRNNSLWHIAPWEDESLQIYLQRDKKLYIKTDTAWVARLFSGKSALELPSEAAGKSRSVSRILGIHTFIDAISDDYMGNVVPNLLTPLTLNITSLLSLRSQYTNTSSANQTKLVSEILKKSRQIFTQSCLPIAKLSKLLLTYENCKPISYSFYDNSAHRLNLYSLSISASVLAISSFITKDEKFKSIALHILDDLINRNTLLFLSKKCLAFLDSSPHFKSKFYFVVDMKTNSYKEIWYQNVHCSLFQNEMLRILNHLPLYLVLDTLVVLESPIQVEVAKLASYWMKSSEIAIGITRDLPLTLDLHNPLSSFPIWIELPHRPDLNLLYDINLLSLIYYSHHNLGDIEKLAYLTRLRLFKHDLLFKDSAKQLPAFPIALDKHQSNINTTKAIKKGVNSSTLFELVDIDSSLYNEFIQEKLGFEVLTSYESPYFHRGFTHDFGVAAKSCTPHIENEDLAISLQPRTVPALYLYETGRVGPPTGMDSIYSTLNSSCSVTTSGDQVTDKALINRSTIAHAIILVTMFNQILPGIFHNVKGYLCSNLGTFCEDLQTLKFLLF